MVREAGAGALRAGQLSAASEAGFAAEKAAGNAALRAGRFADAVAHYTLAEEIDPVSPVAPANRALAHLKAGQFAAAAADATVALALQDAAPRAPGHDALRVKLLLRRAAARTELAQLQPAAQDLAEAVAIQPGHAAAQNGLRRLRDAHGVVPRPHGAPPAPRIAVVEGAPASSAAPVRNGGSVNGGAPRARARAPPPAESELVQEFPLMRISESARRGLAAKWAATPPRDALEFERAWKSLRGRAPERARYLALVGEARVLGGIFGHSLTAQMLHEFVAALAHGDFADPGFRDPAARVLHAVSRIPRFDIALMLLSAEERADAEKLVAKFAEQGVASDLVAKLKAGFELA